MHQLARNFAMQIDKRIKEDDLLKYFRLTMTYKNIYLGKLQGLEIVSAEQILSGEIKKYVNNDCLTCCEVSDPFTQKAGCLSHYS